MLKRLKHICALLCAIQVFLAGVGAQSEARDLTDVLGRGFSFEAPDGGLLELRPGEVQSLVDFSKAAKTVAPTFASAIAQAVTQEFPFASVAPAFIYRLNPAVDTFERLTGVPGPLFSERALTLGKGKLNFSVGYSFIDYSSVNGVDLADINSPGLFTELIEEPDRVIGHLPTGERILALPFTLSRIRTRIDLDAHVIAPTVRYGITDQWDINLTLPIINTYLRVRNEAVRIADMATAFAEGVGFVDPNGNLIDIFSIPPEELGRQLWQVVKSRRPKALLSKASGSATGVGDLTLRSKYQFWQNGFGGAAGGLNLQLPTGEDRDFHGTGQTHVLTFLYLSQVLGERVEPHLNLGIDFNANDVDRSSFLYAVGGTVRIGTRLGVVIDFLGRSEFGKLQAHPRPEDILTEGILDRSPNTCTERQPCFVEDEVRSAAFPIKSKRNDIANFSFGLRYALGAAGSLFFGGIIPLNDDGFRADFIPSGGIEYTF